MSSLTSSTTALAAATRAAERALTIEAEAIRAAEGAVHDQLAEAIETMSTATGRVIVSGLGKSGHIAGKIAATLASTGTPAHFVHSAEALHGDSGMVAPGDVAILISYSGTTAEVCQFARMIRARGVQTIAMTSHADSPLAKECDHWLSIAVEREADPLGLAPTASTAVTLALGDALAAGLMTLSGFGEADFGLRHPGGALGEQTKDALEQAGDLATAQAQEAGAHRG